MAINKIWHGKYIMPKNASTQERISWHKEHQKYCNCRPSPATLVEQMKNFEGGENSMSTKDLIQSYYTSLNQKDDTWKDLYAEDAYLSLSHKLASKYFSAILY